MLTRLKWRQISVYIFHYSLLDDISPHIVELIFGVTHSDFFFSFDRYLYEVFRGVHRNEADRTHKCECEKEEGVAKHGEARGVADLVNYLKRKKFE
jgi:hypothetical protein